MVPGAVARMLACFRELDFALLRGTDQGKTDEKGLRVWEKKSADKIPDRESGRSTARPGERDLSSLSRASRGHLPFTPPNPGDKCRKYHPSAGETPRRGPVARGPPA